jgi:hypothetical protein
VKVSWSDQGNLRNLTFDAAIGETHLVSATVTEHPVEKGAAITDNVRPGPLRISCEVVISNFPITLPSANDDSFTEGVSRRLDEVILTETQNGKAWKYSTALNRVRNVYDALTLVAQAGTPVDIATSLMVYTDMIIVAISAPRSVEMGSSAIRFTMDCQQIRTVESQLVAPVAPKAQKKKVGHKGEKKEEDKDKASLAHNAAGKQIAETLDKGMKMLGL